MRYLLQLLKSLYEAISGNKLRSFVVLITSIEIVRTLFIFNSYIIQTIGNSILCLLLFSYVFLRFFWDQLKEECTDLVQVKRVDILLWLFDCFRIGLIVLGFLIENFEVIKGQSAIIVKGVNAMGILIPILECIILLEMDKVIRNKNKKN